MEANNTELIYSISGGYPPVQASLTVGGDGVAQMFVGTSWLLPAPDNNRVGWFGGALPAGQLRRLRRAVAAFSAAPALPQATYPMDSVVRRLRLSSVTGAYETDLPDPHASPEAARLDEQLRQVMDDLVKHPCRVVDLSVFLREGGACTPLLRITNRGSEVVNLALYEPGRPPQLLSATLKLEAKLEFPDGSFAWNPKTVEEAPPEYLLSLLEQGSLPLQASLALGGCLEIPLPSLAQSCLDSTLFVSGSAEFWLADQSQAHRLVKIQSGRQPVESRST